MKEFDVIFHDSIVYRPDLLLKLLKLSSGFSNIIYLFLYFQNSATKIERKQLQLVGVAAMFIASKYEEMYAPEIGNYYLSNRRKLLYIFCLLVKFH